MKLTIRRFPGISTNWAKSSTASSFAAELGRGCARDGLVTLNFSTTEPIPEGFVRSISMMAVMWKPEEDGLLPQQVPFHTANL